MCNNYIAGSAAYLALTILEFSCGPGSPSPDYQEALYDISGSSFLMTTGFCAILPGWEKALEAIHKPAETGGGGKTASVWDD
jgi:hypothetical protein